jgi:predicted phosphodiesterase
MSSSSKPPKTRILIISDTHGSMPGFRGSRKKADPYSLTILPSFVAPLPEADVAIHCGDLTMSWRQSTSLKEYRTALSLLKSIPAPLKIVIPGNHDTALDKRYDGLWSNQRPCVDARTILSSAADDGVHLLVEEGTYNFVLSNGARLRVFASPWTPRFGSWAFQYDGEEGHHFPMESGLDVAITHGPPNGILDTARSGTNAGCGLLAERTIQARPRVHCFGHIHEGWGATIVKWDKTKNDGQGIGFEEELVENIDTMVGTRQDTPEVQVKKMARRNEWVKMYGGRLVDATTVQQDKETLFVNAAVVTTSYKPVQLPWLVDLDLPLATDEDWRRAGETTALLQHYRQRSHVESASAADRT